MIRHLLCLLLAFTVAATSVSAAVMHSEMQGASQIEICADSHDGSGLTSITLDATGKQITHHSCPDCTAAFAALLANLTQSRPLQSYRASIFAQMATDATSRSAPTQSARDPPTFA
jgi:hypothetical protein